MIEPSQSWSPKCFNVDVSPWSSGEKDGAWISTSYVPVGFDHHFGTSHAFNACKSTLASCVIAGIVSGEIEKNYVGGKSKLHQKIKSNRKKKNYYDNLIPCFIAPEHFYRSHDQLSNLCLVVDGGGANTTRLSHPKFDLHGKIFKCLSLRDNALIILDRPKPSKGLIF